MEPHQQKHIILIYLPPAFLTFVRGVASRKPERVAERVSHLELQERLSHSTSSLKHSRYFRAAFVY